MLTISVESSKCTIFYTESVCGGSPFPKRGYINNCFRQQLLILKFPGGSNYQGEFD